MTEDFFPLIAKNPLGFAVSPFKKGNIFIQKKNEAIHHPYSFFYLDFFIVEKVLL